MSRAVRRFFEDLRARLGEWRKRQAEASGKAMSLSLRRHSRDI
jgi:hypothetical protein